MEKKRIILEARDLHKSFSFPEKLTILKGVNLTVCEGESVAIVGRSGEGKSTLLQILGTLEDSSKGTLTIDNQCVNGFNQSRIRNQLIGFVFQSFHLLEDYTALENVLMPALIGRQSIDKGSPAEIRALSLLEQVGLSQRARHHTQLLSGGEKQRVAIARALCNDPKIIFADEPSGNLDRENASHIHELLLGFLRNHDKALVIVTHDRELAMMCDRQYELRNGILIELS